MSTEGQGVPRQSLFVPAADGVRIHVQLRQCGGSSGPTCVLLHGFGDGGYVWEDTCIALGESCSTAVVDLRGHGESEHSATDAYDLPTHLRDVEAIVAQLGLTSIIIVGHSFGGEIALRIAARPPVPVLGAVFVDISPGANQQTAKQATVYLHETLRAYRSVEDYCSVLLQMRPLLPENKARQIALNCLRRHEDGFRLKLDPLLMKHADDEFTTAQEWQDLLSRVRCPALVVRGAGSAMVSADAAKEMVRTLARAQLVTIARAGHAVLSDNSSESSASIARFVRTHAVPA